MSVRDVMAAFLLANGLTVSHAFYDCRDRTNLTHNDSWHICSDGPERYSVIADLCFLGLFVLSCLAAGALLIYKERRDERAANQWTPVSNVLHAEPLQHPHPSRSPKPPLSLTVTVFTQHLMPKFDVDFRHKPRQSKVYSGGGHTYLPPLGSYRYALAVLGKYPDGDEWLGCRGGPGEWQVAYHGTKIKNANAIIREGFKLDKCQRAT